jgi:hypothetical protein
MAWRWDGAHDGSPHLLGFVGDRLAGQVARYDVVDGAGPGWVGFVRGERVTDRCGTDEEARRLVELRSEGGRGSSGGDEGN